MTTTKGYGKGTQMKRAIQLIDNCKDIREAIHLFSAIRLQNGYLGGRILAPTNGDPFRVQALFVDDTPLGDTWLPDGCRHVLVPDSMWKRLA